MYKNILYLCLIGFRWRGFWEGVCCGCRRVLVHRTLTRPVLGVWAAHRLGSGPRVPLSHRKLFFPTLCLLSPWVQPKADGVQRSVPHPCRTAPQLLLAYSASCTPPQECAPWLFSARDLFQSVSRELDSWQCGKIQAGLLKCDIEGRRLLGND